MKLKWPYKLLLVTLLLAGTGFAVSPFIAMYALADSTKDNNTERWKAQVETAQLSEYTSKLLDGLLRVKMSLEMRSKKTDTATAMQDYTFAQSGINRQSRKIVAPKGFAHLLCGEVARYPEYPAQHDSECWALDGQLHWQSLTRVKVSYKNPESGWFSHLYLDRTGLFNWQVVDIELPVEEMIKQLESQLLGNS